MKLVTTKGSKIRSCLTTYAGVHSSLLILILTFGTLFSLLYAASIYESEPTTLPNEPTVSQEQAIAIADSDLRKHLQEYHGITRILVNTTSGYIPMDEFKSKNMTIPLVYVHPTGELILLNRDDIHHTQEDQENLGYCSMGLHAYCGFLPPFDFNYRGKVVYGVEVTISYGQGDGISFMYMVDAVDGKIVDSTFLRNEKINSIRDE